MEQTVRLYYIYVLERQKNIKAMTEIANVEIKISIKKYKHRLLLVQSY